MDEDKDTDIDDNIVELVDEDGNTVKFEYVMTVEHETGAYALMSPADNSEEAVIFRLNEQENGDVTLTAVDNEALMEEIYDIYLENTENGED